MKILIIFNNYKNILNDFINYANSEFLDWSKQINKRLYNMLKSKDSLMSFLKENNLNKNVSTLDKLS